MSARTIGVTPAPLYEQERNPKPVARPLKAACERCGARHAPQLMYKTYEGYGRTLHILCAICREAWLRETAKK